MVDSTANQRALRDQTLNKYCAYLFRAFLALKTALPDVCVDWLFGKRRTLDML